MTFHPSFEQNGYDTQDYESVGCFVADVQDDCTTLLDEAFRAISKEVERLENKLQSVRDAYESYEGDIDALLAVLEEV